MAERPLPRILLFGASGQLGTTLRGLSQTGDFSVLAPTSHDANFSRPEEVARVLEQADHIDIVVNAAAYTNVDKAEREEPLATVVNGRTVGRIAEFCNKRDTPLIHISTDYVFDGKSDAAYTEVDGLSPINAYGRSKLAGEEAIRASLKSYVIVRTAWLYSAVGTNFVRTMLRLGADRDELRVVDDQYGTPTSAHDLAVAIVSIAKQLTTERPSSAHFGVFHYAGAGATTWRLFAEEIFARSAEWHLKRARIVPITTSEYGALAPRPANSRLNCSKLEQVYCIAPVPWRSALESVLSELKSQQAAVS